MAFLLTIQVLLISTGVLTLAMFLKLSLYPFLLNFSTYNIQSPLLSWLQPPYLYIIINFIILTIAASSCFHRDETQETQDRIQMDRHKHEESMQQLYDSDRIVYDDAEIVKAGSFVEFETAKVDEEKSHDEVAVNRGDGDDNEEFVIRKSTWMPPKRMDSSENFPEIVSPAEKSLVSSRFGHRKPVKASPEGGRALKVSRPKRHETLESTWKTITEGRAMPLTRHLKRRDSWENHKLQVNPDPHAVKKSEETLKDRTNQMSPPLNSSPGSRLRKEPSLSQDELNRRVEAFIKKFNEQMRLQREESLNQYKEMISRGIH